LRILLVNRADAEGGAARAAYRLHRALLGHGLDSTLAVDLADTGDPSVIGRSTPVAGALARLRSMAGSATLLLAGASIAEPRSTAVVPSRWGGRLGALAPDVLHLHWINQDMLSIAAIGALQGPIVWTLHDMWAFCGTEHYPSTERWRDGYRRGTRLAGDRGVDVDRWTWRRKRRHWTRPMHIVAPSRWMADCVRASRLMCDWPVTVIPNAIDTDVWQPVERGLARSLLGLPPDGPLLLFGAAGGGRDPRKGLDLLLDGLALLRDDRDRPGLVVLGRHRDAVPRVDGFAIHGTGPLRDDLTLRLAYSAVDAVAVPSRQDNLPNGAVEALACGVPVVAFDTCGLPDVVRHRQTGWLARPFDAADFATGIRWVLADTERHAALREAARADAVARFSAPIVAAAHEALYRSL
jgi:glycosyltransferase involved in cell wall biosynthesis